METEGLEQEQKGGLGPELGRALKGVIDWSAYFGGVGPRPGSPPEQEVLPKLQGLTGSQGEIIHRPPAPLGPEGNRIHEEALKKTKGLNQKYHLIEKLGLPEIESNLFLLSLLRLIIREGVNEFEKGIENPESFTRDKRNLGAGVESSLQAQENNLENLSPEQKRNILLSLHTAAAGVYDLINTTKQNNQDFKKQINSVLTNARERVLGLKTTPAAA